jgi:4'-phosphopantetheinyl transferase EntD
LIEFILPSCVESEEAYNDFAYAPLYAVEEQIVARAVAGRRFEFATSRACARRALGLLGLPPTPIGRGRHGNPVWPAGVVGSITHCEGYRAAAVAWSTSKASIGIDAEPAAALPAGLLSSIADPRESRQARALAVEDPATPWDRLLFSAKESVYKAWFSLAEQNLGLKDVHVVLGPDRGVFSGWVLSNGASVSEAVKPAVSFEGRWMIGGDLMVTTASPKRKDCGE